MALTFMSSQAGYFH